MKAMINNRQLLAGLNKGYIDDVAKDLNRYQVIESNGEWEHNGDFFRKKTFLVKHSKGVARWHVEMKNGNITGVGVVHQADLTKPIITA